MVLELDDLIGKNGYSENDFRLDTAILLYERKVASLSRAAKVAGISQSEFEAVLQEKNIAIPNKKQTANERALNELALDDPLRQAIKPLRKNVTAEQIAAEQGYKKTDLNRLRKLAEDLAIEEPLELLLEQLKG